MKVYAIGKCHPDCRFCSSEWFKCYSRMLDNLPQRFLEKIIIDQETGCCIWTGSHVGKVGYGYFWSKSGSCRAHKFCYESIIGPVPKGMELDHLCRNTLCVLPYHLEPVSHLENVRRGVSSETSGKYQKEKTHCVNGHEFNNKNTYYPNPKHRQCRICKSVREKERRRKIKEG